MEYFKPEIFSLVYNLMKNNNLFLAEKTTLIFIPPEQRTIKYFEQLFEREFIESSFKQLKLSRIKFLINYYDGFDNPKNQEVFLSLSDLNEQYLAKIFPNYNFFSDSNYKKTIKNFLYSESYSLPKKMSLISYLSKKSATLEINLLYFFENQLQNNIINVEQLKKYDFFEKLYSKETVINYFKESKTSLDDIENYLSFFYPKKDILDTLLTQINSHENKENLIQIFVKKYPDYIVNLDRTPYLINHETLKKYDLIKYFTDEKYLMNILKSTNKPLGDIDNHLKKFLTTSEIPNIVLSLISKINDETYKYSKNDCFAFFIKNYPSYVEKNQETLEKFAIDNDIIIDKSSYDFLQSKFKTTEAFDNYVAIKNSELYFYIKNPETDPTYIDKFTEYTIKSWRFLINKDDEKYKKTQQLFIDGLKKNYTNDELFDIFFTNFTYVNGELSTLCENTDLVIYKNLTDLNKEELNQCIQLFRNGRIANVYDELRKKPWYDFSYKKPLQILFQNNKVSIITDPLKVYVPVENIATESVEPKGFNTILLESKKDLHTFNQLTSQPLDFNLEFKIRAETILMEQSKFLTQIQKIENDLAYDDLYFLKNNLGKYLIQSTETYARALSRYQTLLDNPSFSKKTETLDSQKEKIDTEALKQVTLLEKELDFVKQHVIETLNSDTMADMRIKTRFLQAKIEHNDETSGIIKLEPNKMKQN